MRPNSRTLIGLAVVGFWAFASAPTWAIPIRVDISSQMFGGAAGGWELDGPTNLNDNWVLFGVDSYSHTFEVTAGEYEFGIWGGGLGLGKLSWSLLIGDQLTGPNSISVFVFRLFENGATFATPTVPTVTVAEPGAAALAGLGLLCMLLARRRRAVK